MTRRAPSPCSHATEPHLFGLTNQINWRPARDDLAHQADLLAAQWQHDLAVQTRRHAIDQYGSVAAYAAATGQSHRRIVTVLNGTTPTRLDGLATAGHLGSQLGTVKNET